MKFYRVQPAGHDIVNHRSITSAETLGDKPTSNGVHVFPAASQIFGADAEPSEYGDEVIEIEAADSWDSEDVEGEAIDPATSTITRRWTLDGFAKLFGFATLDDALDAYAEDASGFPEIAEIP